MNIGSPEKIEAHSDRVDEQTDQRFDFAKGAIGDRRAYNDVGCTGIAMHQRRQRRHDHVKQRCLLALAKKPQPRDQLPIKAHAVMLAAKCPVWRPRMIERQIG